MASRLVLFDCDGTLIESHGAIVTAMRLAFVQNRCPPPAAFVVRSLVGLSADAMIHVLCQEIPDPPEGAIRSSFASILRRDSGLFSGAEHMVPGMRSAITTLDDHATVLGIVTGSERDVVERILFAFDLGGAFTVRVTADDGPSKPAPQLLLRAMEAGDVPPERTVVVGSTVFDVLMGRAAGTATVGLPCGAHAAESLEICGADAVIHRPEDVPGAVDALVPVDVPAMTLH